MSVDLSCLERVILNVGNNTFSDNAAASRVLCCTSETDGCF
jgi:hypothetical protein